MTEHAGQPVALITGSSRGIGLATALRLAGDGYHVLVNGRENGPELEAALCAVRARADGIGDALAFDVSEPTQVRAAFRTLHAEFGRLDALVVNAGILGDALIGMIPDDLPERVFRVNAGGAVLTLQAGARLMSRRRRGSIVLVSSIVGRVGNVGQVVYAASKAAVIGATLAAARELGATGVRVNAIAPGMIQTSMIGHLAPEVIAERTARTALGRLGTVEEVADAIAFLVSDSSRFITGQVLGVDGGLVL